MLHFCAYAVHFVVSDLDDVGIYLFKYVLEEVWMVLLQLLMPTFHIAENRDGSEPSVVY